MSPSARRACLLLAALCLAAATVVTGQAADQEGGFVGYKEGGVDGSAVARDGAAADSATAGVDDLTTAQAGNDNGDGSLNVAITNEEADGGADGAGGAADAADNVEGRGQSARRAAARLQVLNCRWWSGSGVRGGSGS